MEARAPFSVCYTYLIPALKLRFNGVVARVGEIAHKALVEPCLVPELERDKVAEPLHIVKCFLEFERLL